MQRGSDSCVGVCKYICRDMRLSFLRHTPLNIDLFIFLFQLQLYEVAVWLFPFAGI